MSKWVTPVEKPPSRCALFSPVDTTTPSGSLDTRDTQLSTSDFYARVITVRAKSINSECSYSSRAKMSSYVVGSYQMSPMTHVTKVLFILKYLRPAIEYLQSLGHLFEYRALDLTFHYINVRKTCHAHLSFEALGFLGSLLLYKKFCIEFVNRGGVQILLQVSRAWGFMISYK